jgi:hypothetical protein
MALFTLTVTDASQDTKAKEVQRIARALQVAAIEVRSAGGALTSGNILDDGAVVIGSWTYTGSATKTG